MSQVGTPISVPAQSSANLISRSGWEHWLIEESIRRTIITAFMLNGVYASLRFGCERDEVMRFTFTAQAALWNTNSEVGWRRACSEKEHLETHITDWDEVMAKAKPEDLEEMGVLVMAMLRGTESTETWLGRKYASRYGFENLISTVT
ncbi:hypothetical protein NX059_011464 [Plenodomus lindquistii]|nr:hypothetical protein NX059_011464 [Plenodomus lindquistii]